MPLHTVQPRGQITLTREIRKAAGIRPGDVVLTRVTAPGTVEVKALPTLSLAQLLDRYRITRPVNMELDRELWQAEAAGELLSQSGA